MMSLVLVPALTPRGLMLVDPRRTSARKGEPNLLRINNQIMIYHSTCQLRIPAN